MEKYKTTSKSPSTSGRGVRTAKRKPVWRRIWLSYKGWIIRLFLYGVEVSCFTIAGLITVLLLVGTAAHFFNGTDLMSNLLPFVLCVFSISLGFALSIILWWRIRKSLISLSIVLPSLLAVALAIGAGQLTNHQQYDLAYRQLRIMVGGKKEIHRITLAHQIYAAYRRLKGAQLVKLAERTEPYKDDIMAAANAFSLDPDLLFGLAAAESSFYPRKSKDGGEGLFQITNVPRGIKSEIKSLLKKEAPPASKHRHNAFIASATLKKYLTQMGGDHPLGLLAYNIGPANGGLKFIMEQYRASDFTTIQPYLQSGPRNYPIRVLSFALAFRIWHQEGKFLTYEKGGNAIIIQKIGIPGLDGF